MMYCNECGTKLTEGEKFCSNCGKKIEEEYVNTDIKEEEIKEEAKKNSNSILNNIRPRKLMVLIKLGLYILAVVVIIMFFNGADSIGRASYKMITLRSVSGETVAEAYYQYYGTFLSGLENVVRALGITCGVIIAYIGKKIDYEKIF